MKRFSIDFKDLIMVFKVILYTNSNSMCIRTYTDVRIHVIERTHVIELDHVI